LVVDEPAAGCGDLIRFDTLGVVRAQ